MTHLDETTRAYLTRFRLAGAWTAAAFLLTVGTVACTGEADEADSEDSTWSEDSAWDDPDHAVGDNASHTDAGVYGADGYGADGYGTDGYGGDGDGSDGYGTDGYGGDGYRNDGYGNDGAYGGEARFRGRDGSDGQRRMPQSGHPAEVAGAQSGRGGSGGRVQIYDQGLQVVRATLDVPPGWSVNHDIATDPGSGQPVRYQFDIFGPRGELIRNGAPIVYSSYMGQDFRQMWRQAAMGLLQGVLQDPQIGNLQQSRAVQSVRLFQQLAQQTRADGLEAPVRGSRDGRPFTGRVYLIHMPMEAMGQFTFSIAVSPDPLWQQTEAINLQIANSMQVSPQFEQAMTQIGQRMSNDHQRRMAGNQARFEAHQQSMRSQQQAFDQTNQQWMNDFRASGGSGVGSGSGYSDGYGSHEAYIDGIYEQQTFQDPYSGQQVQMDGQYDHNYTDGLGNYYGTNDASFDPNSLQGDWTETQPLNDR